VYDILRARKNPYTSKGLLDQLTRAIAERARVEFEKDRELQRIDEEIEQLKADLNARLSAAESARPAAPAPASFALSPPTEEETNGKPTTLQGRILAVLKDATTPLNSQQVADKLKENERRVFYSLQTLRSRNEGLIVKPGKGLWMLASNAKEAGIDAT
jgi:hypothetical protein